MSLPALREEIDLHEGPRLRDGQPTWTLHDPSRNQFFQIDWQTFCILGHWHLDDAQAICDAVGAGTTLSPEPDDVEVVANFLLENQLLQPLGAESASWLAGRLRMLRGTWHSRLLRNYLFFRIPLVNPDGWLERWSARVAPLYSSAFLQLTLLALVVGLVLVYRNWGQFSATLVDTLSWQGLVAYGVALVCVKLLHELGHAFTAKRFGCRVPAMGIAFLVLWPVAYTDTNEVWKLSNAKSRLAVAASGVATETVIAIWATLAWALLPEGTAKSIAFVLATLSWFTTLAINASPFLRFDGYFVLSDWLDMPNLHARSFALARWDLRERLFGLDAPPPEYFARRKQAALILFAWCTWLYRLVVFIGIAVLVYHLFIKLAGILLFIVEVAWFIARPVWSEVKVWKELWPVIRTRARARRTILILVLLIGVSLLPWPTRLSSSGHLRPQESYTVYAPTGAQIAELSWKEGMEVPQGATLVKLASPDLELRWQRATGRQAKLREQAGAAGLDVALQQNVQVLQQELASAEAEIASVRADAVRYSPTAPFAGRAHIMDPELRPGTWVRKQEPLVTLVKPGAWIVETYLDEEEVRRVAAGDGGRFFADGREGPALPLRVTAVDQDATRVLPQGMLSVKHGGSVITRDSKEGTLVPERSVYRVTLAVEDDPGVLAGHDWRGKVVIRGSWEAPGMRYVRAALALVWREAGF